MMYLCVFRTDSDLKTRLMGRTKYANIPEILYLYRRHPSQLTAQQNSKRSEELARNAHSENQKGFGRLDPGNCRPHLPDQALLQAELARTAIGQARSDAHYRHDDRQEMG